MEKSCIWNFNPVKNGNRIPKSWEELDEEKAIQIYNVTYKQFIDEGYPEKIAITCAIMAKAGAEIMAEYIKKRMKGVQG